MSERELDAIAEKIDAILAPLNEEDRIAVLHNLAICLHCGYMTKGPCYCWNDE